MEDIRPGGGGTYFWPGSCHAVHRYFKRYPEDLPTGGALATSHPGAPASVHGLDLPGEEGMTCAFMERTCPGGYGGSEPVEAVMRAGSAVIWHREFARLPFVSHALTCTPPASHAAAGQPLVASTGSQHWQPATLKPLHHVCQIGPFMPRAPTSTRPLAAGRRC